MRVAVIGANGQLGTDIAQAFAESGDSVSAFTHADVEISDADAILARMRDLQPQIIVNTAAMHHVEKCEQDPQSAFAANALGARNLALAACELEAALVHISTDYVFDGSKKTPYEESDLPKPLNVYGNTKLAGEHFVQAIAPKHYVLRTSALYGKAPCRAKGGLNFVELMLKLARERGEVRVVASEVVTPTPTRELAQQVAALSRSGAYGLYHATAEGSCSWYEFAREIFSITNTPCRLNAAGPGEFPAKVPRPSYSVLENSELKRHGLNLFRHWQHGLQEYLGQRELVAARTT
jgi:dTDP-4-dehydrorhamnose reductase